jgi:hypothetical protein
MKEERVMKRFVVMAVLSILLAATASAQQGPGGRGDGGGMPGKGQRMYDPSKVETVSGEVVAVKELMFRNGMRKGIGLKLNTGSQTMFVHLGPQWFIEQQSVKIAAGDKVEVTGVKTVRREKEVFVAGEVRKGGEVLKLRDAGGVPLWAGSGPGGGKPQQ